MSSFSAKYQKQQLDRRVDPPRHSLLGISLWADMIFYHSGNRFRGFIQQFQVLNQWRFLGQNPEEIAKLTIVRSVPRVSITDIKDDGDYKLVVADQKGKLKIYMGTNVISNEKLGFEKPTALEVFYESTKKPQLPIIAIASGSSLYYFQNFQPISKFELPYIQFSPEEKEVWTQITKVAEEQEFVSLCDRLFAIRESGIAISTISSELLSLENALEQMDYARQNYTMLIQHQNFITCMTRINKSLDEEKAVGMLVIGTEQRNIFIMDQSGMSVKKQITLKSVPTFIQCIGQFDVEYRIYAACRDGKVYVTRQGEVTDQIFSIESKPVGLLLFEKQIVVASMNNTLHSFFLKGKKNFTMNLPAGVVDIQKLEVKRTQQSTNGQCLIVALNNGELRLYNSKDKNLIHILKNEDLISGMSYGTFGREEIFKQITSIPCRDTLGTEDISVCPANFRTRV